MKKFLSVVAVLIAGSAYANNFEIHANITPTDQPEVFVVTGELTQAASTEESNDGVILPPCHFEETVELNKSTPAQDCPDYDANLNLTVADGKYYLEARGTTVTRIDFNCSCNPSGCAPAVAEQPLKRSDFDLRYQNSPEDQPRPMCEDKEGRYRAQPRRNTHNKVDSYEDDLQFDGFYPR